MGLFKVSSFYSSFIFALYCMRDREEGERIRNPIRTHYVINKRSERPQHIADEGISRREPSDERGPKSTYQITVVERISLLFSSRPSKLNSPCKSKLNLHENRNFTKLPSSFFCALFYRPFKIVNFFIAFCNSLPHHKYYCLQFSSFCGGPTTTTNCRGKVKMEKSIIFRSLHRLLTSLLKY